MEDISLKTVQTTPPPGKDGGIGAEEPATQTTSKPDTGDQKNPLPPTGKEDGETSETGIPEGQDDSGSDDGVLEIDDQGNLVNEKGEVIREKGKFKLEDDGTVTYEEEQPSVIETLTSRVKEIGYELPEGVSFTDDTDGFLDLAKTVAKQMRAADEKADDPIVQEVRTYLANGGDINKYFENKVSFANLLNVNNDSPDDDKRLVVKEFLKKTISDPETVEFTYQSIIDSGKLEEQFQKASKGLKTIDQKEKERLTQLQELQRQQHEQEIAEVNAKVTNIVKNGKVGDFVIPEAERENFRKFLIGDFDGRGNAERLYAYQKLSLEDRVKLDFFVYKGLNVDDYIKARVQQEKADALKKRKLSAKQGNQVTRKVKRVPTGTQAYSNISIKSIQ